MMYDTYKDLNEFIEDIERIGEIEFEYKGKDYSLLYYDKIYICEYNKPETEKEYDTIEEFLDDYKIDSVPIRELATEIKVFAH
ncbi:hypothetical protein SAMN02745195_02354 [Thermoanaerobacter uzonensis DSM 18761]|uniref:Uncharacterized protein n=1 Tax=Thermoanaerobacter uzonensis DSM 18761 TaxID=1123369 RepID=A0A1M5AMS3_9THEO|nr:hypothetical protein [Thermoanaerobacter uzonensis]SHF31444.1 hypothetical protein SAMN02745195_02354 [Thermoanaerobacter uzonensis DSM 18761]